MLLLLGDGAPGAAAFTQPLPGAGPVIISAHGNRPFAASGRSLRSLIAFPAAAPAMHACALLQRRVIRNAHAHVRATAAGVDSCKLAGPAMHAASKQDHSSGLCLGMGGLLRCRVFMHGQLCRTHGRAAKRTWVSASARPCMHAHPCWACTFQLLTRTSCTGARTVGGRFWNTKACGGLHRDLEASLSGPDNRL